MAYGCGDPDVDPDSHQAISRGRTLMRPGEDRYHPCQWGVDRAFCARRAHGIGSNPAMHPPARLRILMAVSLLICAMSSPAAARAQPAVPVIAAASDLRFAIEALRETYRAETGMEIRIALGSTGNFARQIRAGAPFDIFMAADERFVLDLHRDGFTRDAGDRYARGRIVIVVPHGVAMAADGNLDTLADALAAGTIRRFAIANPDHAPYGMRAREALQHRGLWEALEAQLVLGENVSQAAQFALSGNTSGGIVAYSIALAPSVAGRGSYALIPESWHQPLDQRMALLADAGPAAERFYAWLVSPPARAVLARYGFVLPES